MKRFRNQDPLPISLSPLHVVGKRVPLPSPPWPEGSYGFDSAGAHDPKYTCNCDKVAGYHPRTECGTKEGDVPSV